MNPKARGEKGQRIVIGELAKFDVDVAIPLSDNLPFDIIIYYKSKLFRAQVKSSRMTKSNGSVEFSLRSNNWYKGTTKKYCKDDCDLMILCDYQNVYLLKESDFAGRSSFTIRSQPSVNNQVKNANSSENYVLSQKRLEEVCS